MKIESATNLTAIRISDLDRLDPITVIFQNFNPGEGRIFIQCYDKVWSSYWGSVSGKTVQAFVADGGPDYIVNNLVSHQLPAKQRKAEVEYVTRIVTAIQAALAVEQAPPAKPRAPEPAHRFDPSLREGCTVHIPGVGDI